MSDKDWDNECVQSLYDNANSGDSRAAQELRDRRERIDSSRGYERDHSGLSGNWNSQRG